jgi:predicted nucleotidyltransferase
VGSHYPEGEEPSAEQFEQALADVATALDGSDIDYVLMGGVGTATMARPRSTDDIDVFVTPDHATKVLEILEAAGFTTRVEDPIWLYKAFKYGVLVDVIFRSIGDIYVDHEMLDRAEMREFKGSRLRMIPPEDLLVIKAVAASEHQAHHWYDALAIIARQELDWDYVIRRARSAGPRRVLSLLLYAESTDLAVPITALRDLLNQLYPTTSWDEA